jgi:tRNA-specific 2-thiouridylase
MVPKITGKRGRKIVVGMSGGVDSSMALLLLIKQGWRPVGVSLKYPVWKDPANCLRENVCCSEESFRIARDVCDKLGVPYFVYDVSRKFKKAVIDYFLGRLRLGKTPNPCVMCNRFLKFKELFRWGSRHGIEYVATGHYARVRRNPGLRKYELLKARDTEKDQTYSLSFLDQSQLARLVLPLGHLKKREVYRMAEKAGFEIFLKQKQSQDFCFVSGKAMNAFLAKKIGLKPGDMLNDEGKIIGRHRGLHFYTIGQRKGLGLSGGPYFVRGHEMGRNTLEITKDEKCLFQKEIVLKPCHFPSAAPKKALRVQAKIRYRQQGAPAVLILKSKNKALLSFDKPQRAVTPGQFAVCYRRNVCVAAGEIQGIYRS